MSMPKGSHHTVEARARMSAALMGHPAYNWSHGMFGTSEHRAYFAAKHRCTNSNNPQWHNYGGRGIKFLFRDFNHFMSVIGRKPSKEYSLDRIDNDGNYEPCNVRWATNKEQGSNRKVKTLRNYSDKELLGEVKRRGLLRCTAIYEGPSVAKGGRCLLDKGHNGDHETYGIMVGIGNADKFTIINDGSENWHFTDSERLKTTSA